MASNRYTRIDRNLIQSTLFNANEKIAIMILLEDGTISYRQLAKKMKVCISTAQRIVKGLEEKGVLSHESQYSDVDGTGTNIYSVMNHPDVWECKTDDELREVIADLK